MRINDLPMSFLSLALIAYFSANSHPSPVTLPPASKQISVASRPIEKASKPTPQHASQPQAKKVGREVMATVTAYCPCSICCEGWSGAGKTSRGRDARKTRGVAVDPKAIPYGSMVTIPGYGKFLADDTGGAMRQDWKKGIVHIDLRYHNHKEALRFGVKKMKILIE